MNIFLGEGMTGITNAAKQSEHDRFGENVKNVSIGICGLVEAAAQAAYLVCNRISFQFIYNKKFLILGGSIRSK